MCGYENKHCQFSIKYFIENQLLQIGSFSGYQHIMKVVFNAKLYYFFRYTNIFNNKTHCKEGITLVRNILFYRKLFIGVNKFSNFKANSLLSVNCLTSRICRCPCGVVLAVEKRFKNILEMSRARLNERHSNGF